VKAYAPSLVFVDSFRSVVQSAKREDQSVSDLQRFVQQLGMQMTSWQATTFLIGEYLAPETESSPVFTVADGILWLSQNLHRNSMVRKMQVVKMRGQARHRVAYVPHERCRIQVFPRAIIQPVAALGSAIETSTGEQRVSMGYPASMKCWGRLAGRLFAAPGRAIRFRKNHPGDGISRRRGASGRTRCDCGV